MILKGKELLDPNKNNKLIDNIFFAIVFYLLSLVLAYFLFFNLSSFTTTFYSFFSFFDLSTPEELMTLKNHIKLFLQCFVYFLVTIIYLCIWIYSILVSAVSLVLITYFFQYLFEPKIKLGYKDYLEGKAIRVKRYDMTIVMSIAISGAIIIYVHIAGFLWLFLDNDFIDARIFLISSILACLHIFMLVMTNKLESYINKNGFAHPNRIFVYKYYKNKS